MLTKQPTTRQFSLNSDQTSAKDAIVQWLKSGEESFFVFSGPAGTGKTYTVQALIEEIPGKIIFTAPTNKATKVLRDTLSTDDYKPACCTIYSLLKLKMEANGEVKELKGGNMEDIDLSLYRLVVVDEAGMLNEQVMGFLRAAANEHNVKVLLMGDAFQLPPVKEVNSPVWQLGKKGLAQEASLSRVMRHDNQILTLVTKIRGQINHPAPSFSPKSDNDNDQGVWALTKSQMEGFVADTALIGEFQEGKAKVIAWRNVTVDGWNRFIRSHLFDDTSIPWYEGERVIFTEPAKDLDDETIATTDDEGIITSVSEDWHPVYGEFRVFNLTIVLDWTGKVVVARVLHPGDLPAFTQKSETLAQAARIEKRKWRFFWDFKESFHGVRHAYAITAHRSQGSSFEKVFVEYRDILVNRTRREAFQCLYVGCSRAKRELYLA